MSWFPQPFDGSVDEGDGQQDQDDDDEGREAGPVAAFTGEPWEYTGLPDVGLGEYASGTGYEQTEEEVEASEEARGEVEEHLEMERGEEGFLSTAGEISDMGALAIESTLDPEEGFSVQEFSQEALKWSEYQSEAAHTRVGEEPPPTPDEYEFKSDEEVAEDIQKRFFGSRERIHDVTTGLTEGTRAGPEADTELSRFSSNVGSLSGSLFDIFAVDLGAPIVTSLTGIDPTGGYEAGVLSQPEEGEVTGSTEEVPTGWWEPVFELAAFGAPALIGAGGAKLAGRFAGRGDEVGQLIGKGTESSTQAPSMSAIDELLGVSRRYDEILSGADEPGEAFQLRNVNRNIVPSDDALARGSTSFEEAGTIGLDDLSTTLRGSDDPADLGLSAGDEGGSFIDESDSLDELAETVRGTDEPADLGLSTGDEGPGIFDEIGESVSRRQRQFDEWVSGTDEGLRAGDETAQGFDETITGTRAGDDVARTASETDEAAQTPGGSLLSSLRAQVTTPRLLVGGLGLGGAAAYGITRSDMPGSSQNGRWRHEALTTLAANGRSGVAYAVYRGDERVGVAVAVAKDPLRVLTRGASTRRANMSLSDLRNGTEGKHLEPEFTTLSQARSTFNQWAQEGSGGTQRSDKWDGSIDAPNQVGRTEGFDVEATVENATRQEQRGRFAVEITTRSGTATLATQSATVASGERADISFNVSSTTSRLKPGEYTLILAEQQDGRIDSTGLQVGEGGGGEDTYGWEQPEILRELGDGWYVAVQRHRTEDKQRFIGVGKRDDGARIYLQPSGRVARSPHYFDSAEAVASAYAEWRERAQAGNTDASETPSASAGAPSGGGMRRDTKKKDEGSLGGIVQSILQPGGIGVIGVLVIAVAFYYATDGKPIQWLRSQYNDIAQEVT